MKHVGSLKLIAYGFLVFYGVTFLNYLQLLGHPSVGLYAVLLSLIFLLLLVSSWGVLHWRDWGRQGLVVGNVFLFVVSVWIWRQYPQIVPITYIVFSAVTAVFYSQKNIKAFFQPVSRIARKSILVVDDDEGLLKTVQKALLPNGYSVLTATSGEKGIQIAKLQKPDLIVMDVLLPGIKGREACVILKEDKGTKDIPVLFLTAKDSPDDIEAEMAAGATAHLTKPVNSKTLLAEVRKIIG